MLVEIIDKILITAYVLSCLNVLRHSYFLGQSWVSSETETPIRYTPKPKSLLLLGISLAHVIGGLFSGITI